MKIILAPAKKMEVRNDDFSYRSMPQFMNETNTLLQTLQKFSYAELKKIWNCSDALAKTNEQRLRTMDLNENLSPAVFTYIGLAYQHLCAAAMTDEALDYLQEHLRILSGFYGILKPFDGITPYRLEMQAVIPGLGDLYSWWGSRLYESIKGEQIINLASKEYSQAIEPYLSDPEEMITVVFAEKKQNKLVQKGTMAKIARGEMVYWMAENNVETPEELKNFDCGYRYSKNDSNERTLVFIKNGE